MNNPSTLAVPYEVRVQRAREHEAVGEINHGSLELKEPMRIRPSSVEAKRECARLQMLVLPVASAPMTLSSVRLTSFFNLSVRFWDRNMPSAALSECYKACDELERLGLPMTCVLHNIKKIKELMTHSGRSERELKFALASKKNSLGLNYKLASIYYERMMLNTAEHSLVRCKDLSKLSVELEKNKQSTCLAALSSKEFDAQLSKSSRRTTELLETPRFEYETLQRAEDKYNSILQDIHHVRQLEGIFCTTTGSTKILPCLKSRFTDDNSECDIWWTQIRESPLLFWP